MKNKQFGNILLWSAIGYTLYFLVHCYVNFGLTDSISQIAKYLHPINESWMFFLFVWLNGGAIAFKGKSHLTTYGAALFTIIGTITGWNPDLLGLQHPIHVVAVVLAILMVFVRITIEKAYVLVTMAAVFSASAALMKYDAKTYIIEVVLFVFVFLYYINKR